MKTVSKAHQLRLNLHPKNDHIMHEADNEENEDIMFNMNDEKCVLINSWNS